jgi:hypothetical protein
MKNSCNTINLSRVTRAVILLFWFLVVGTCPAAFGAAVSVDVLWGGLFDNSGQPLAGGKVYTYSAGTTSAKSVYTDSAKTTPAANPVILDGYGRSQVYADGSYKFVIKDADDVTLMTIDNLEYVSSQNPSTLSTSALTALGATIGSLTASLGTLTNMTISSATITLGRLISPEIANASMTGTIHSPTISSATIDGGVLNNVNIASSTINGQAIASFTGSAVTYASMTEYVYYALGNYNEIPHYYGVWYNGSGTSYIDQTIASDASEVAVPFCYFSLQNTTASWTWTAQIEVPLVIRVTTSPGATDYYPVTFKLTDGSGQVYDVDSYTPADPGSLGAFVYHKVNLKGLATIPPGQTKTFYVFRAPCQYYTLIRSYGSAQWTSDPFRVLLWTKL